MFQKMKALPFFPLLPFNKEEIDTPKSKLPLAKCSCHVSAPVPKIMFYCLMSKQWSHWKQDSPRSHSFCKKTIYSLIWLLTLIWQWSLCVSLSVLCFHLQLDSIHWIYCTFACLWKSIQVLTFAIYWTLVSWTILKQSQQNPAMDWIHINDS